MKAIITDEYDEGASIIEGPEEIITKLKEYLLKFDTSRHGTYWGMEEFNGSHYYLSICMLLG